MKHHDYEDDEDFDDDEKSGEEELMSEAIKAKNTEIQVAIKALRSELLDKAIFIAKSNWRWIFMSNKRKMQQVDFVYKSLESLIE
jgi:glutamate-1-semialdehyde aminotransferase